MRIGRAINAGKSYVIVSRAFPTMMLAANWWWATRPEHAIEFTTREEAERWICNAGLKVDHRLVVTERS